MAEKKHTPSVPGPVVSDALMRFDEVSGVVGLRRSAVYDRISRGLFPAPVRLGLRCVRWRASDIQAFIDAQTK
jgi:prophage regulatory protein